MPKLTRQLFESSVIPDSRAHIFWNHDSRIEANRYTFQKQLHFHLVIDFIVRLKTVATQEARAAMESINVNGYCARLLHIALSSRSIRDRSQSKGVSRILHQMRAVPCTVIEMGMRPRSWETWQGKNQAAGGGRLSMGAISAALNTGGV